MRKMRLGAAMLMAGVIALSSGLTTSANALTCSNNYYTGHGYAKKWQTGRARARADWHNRVENALGYPWSLWAKARVRDESCTWGGGSNHCHSKAYPCR